MKFKKMLGLGSLALALVVAACGGANEAATQPEATAPPVEVHENEAQDTETPGAFGLVPSNLPPSELPFATASFASGTYTATAPSYQENPLTVEVEFSENQITSISVVEHGDSTYGSGWFFRSYPAVPDQILVRQSTQDIDAFTGATITRDAIIAAVEDTIAQAGASATDLSPQSIESPLAGDRFIPGFYIVTVPANTMDIYGNTLTQGVDSMLMGDEDMTLLVSLGRNDLHLHVGGARGLGQGNEGHGESVYPGEVHGGTWGGWFFRQVASHQINDTQSTHIDTQTGATQSASAIVWGVEQAIIMAGGNPADITPRSYPLTQITPNPANPDGRFFVPGHHTVTTEGVGGEISMTVTVDRNTIRRIVINEHNEPSEYWDIVWSDLRDLIYHEQTTNDLDLSNFAEAEATANAIINGVRAALEVAGEENPENW